MKRHDLVRHLEAHGCYLLREGRRHNVFANPAANTLSGVPRPTEVNEFLRRKICRDLQVPES